MKPRHLFAALVLSSCATPRQIPVDGPEFKATYLPAVDLAKGKDACWTVVLAALKERNYETKTADQEAGTIETGRRKFTVNATVTSGSAVAIGQMEQSDKIWIKISGDDHRCHIDYTKVRLWNGEEELVNVQSQGGDWYLKNAIRPLNREITGS